MIAEDWIKQCARTDHYRYSRHADRERQNDGLTLAEVEQALASGRIIEPRLSIRTRDDGETAGEAVWSRLRSAWPVPWTTKQRPK